MKISYTLISMFRNILIKFGIGKSDRDLLGTIDLFIRKFGLYLTLIRVSILIIYPLAIELMDRYEFWQKTLTDGLHHYTLVLLFIPIGLLLSGKYRSTFIALGLAIFVEEFTVFLYELGLPHLIYLSTFETGVILAVGLIALRPTLPKSSHDDNSSVISKSHNKKAL